ncbi:hypothetical protein GGX14DRAFT_407170 [Mycena pura]|uniref:Uncharacterized protein n=1 Tax=Mycena pura TaxID=153505 RepID=A0AAD6UT39_9AGAR|nr:hypothetical protein GGX14DRAFT_407170 [Mycena pura]
MVRAPREELAAGVNNLWAVDQHNEGKYKFGVTLHIGLDPFTGCIHNGSKAAGLSDKTCKFRVDVTDVVTSVHMPNEASCDTFGEDKEAEPDSEDDEPAIPAGLTPLGTQGTNAQDILVLMKDMEPATQQMFLAVLMNMSGTNSAPAATSSTAATPASERPAPIPRIFNAAAVQPATTEENRPPFSPRILELAMAVAEGREDKVFEDGTGSAVYAEVLDGCVGEVVLQVKFSPKEGACDKVWAGLQHKEGFRRWEIAADECRIVPHSSMASWSNGASLKVSESISLSVAVPGTHMRSTVVVHSGGSLEKASEAQGKHSASCMAGSASGKFLETVKS